MAAPLGFILRGPPLGPSDSSLHKSDTSPVPPSSTFIPITFLFYCFPQTSVTSLHPVFFYQSSTSSPHHPKSPDKPTSAALYSPPSPPLSLPVQQSTPLSPLLFSRDIVYICPANHRQSLSRPHRCCNNTGGLAGLTLGLIWGVVLAAEACQLL